MLSSRQIKDIIKQLLTVIDKAQASNPDLPPIKPIVIGSAGLMVLGVDYPEYLMPDDIDIAVSNMRLVKSLMETYKKISQLESCPFTILAMNDSAIVCSDYKVVDKQSGESIIVQFLSREDFGLSKEKDYLVDNIPTLSPSSALTSLYHKYLQGIWRNKEQYALLQLYKHRARELKANPNKTHFPLSLADYQSLGHEELAHMMNRLSKPQKSRRKSSPIALGKTSALAFGKP